MLSAQLAKGKSGIDSDRYSISNLSLLGRVEKIKQSHASALHVMERDIHRNYDRLGVAS